MSIPSHLRCDEVVERASDYLERALASGDAEQLEQHLVLCAGCAEYIEQLRAVVQAASKLHAHDAASEAAPEQGGGALDATRLEGLLRAFRSRTQGDE